MIIKNNYFDIEIVVFVYYRTDIINIIPKKAILNNCYSSVEVILNNEKK